MHFCRRDFSCDTHSWSEYDGHGSDIVRSVQSDEIVFCFRQANLICRIILVNGNFAAPARRMVLCRQRKRG